MSHGRMALAAQTPCPEHVPLDFHAAATHVCMSVPQLPHATGLVWPGAHTPVHPPLEHVWFTHAMGVPHMPATHVCTPLPEHCACPAVHAPVHAPAAHVPVAQVTGDPHAPPAHVSTALPEQRVCPDAHALASMASCVTSAGESSVESPPLLLAPELELEPVVASPLSSDAPSGDPVSWRSSMPARAEQPAPAAPTRHVATHTWAHLTTCQC
jgi:hypothetical protein